jgi:hypothetical protein
LTERWWGGDPFTIAQYLTDGAEHRSNLRGYTVTGKSGDYSVLLTDAGISLKGSLPKFLLPTNIHTLSRAGACQAVEKLSNTLHLPMKDAKVTRIDVSTVLIVDRPPSDYYPFLGNKPRYERLQATSDTLYYNTNKRQLIFYNKLAEAKAKGVNIPATFLGENLLRLEARFTERLPKQFNLPMVTGTTLTDERFYTGMVKRWGDEYFSINKLKSTSVMDTSSIKTPKDAKDILFSYLLQNTEAGFVEGFIADLKAKNTYTDPKYYTRTKDELEKLINAKIKAEKSDLINELDTAVREVLINCR